MAQIGPNPSPSALLAQSLGGVAKRTNSEALRAFAAQIADISSGNRATSTVSVAAPQEPVTAPIAPVSPIAAKLDDDKPLFRRPGSVLDIRV